MSKLDDLVELLENQGMSCTVYDDKRISFELKYKGLRFYVIVKDNCNFSINFSIESSVTDWEYVSLDTNKIINLYNYNIFVEIDNKYQSVSYKTIEEIDFSINNIQDVIKTIYDLVY